MRTFTNKKAVPVKQTAKQKLQYVRKTGSYTYSF